MMETVLKWDEDLLLFLNSFHLDFLDPIMFFLTQTGPWIPMYLFLIYLMWQTYGKRFWWVLFAVLLAVAFADQATSAFMKPYFGRLRPCHEPALEGILHNFGKCGGLYGFASSHAANGFAIALCAYLGLSWKFPVVKWLFLWAAFFSYTRIYLGVHYPGDVIVGALVGLISGYLAHFILKSVAEKLFDENFPFQKEI